MRSPLWTSTGNAEPIAVMLRHIKAGDIGASGAGRCRRHQPLKNRILLENYFLPGANRCARDFASDYRSFRIETGGMKVPRLQVLTAAERRRNFNHYRQSLSANPMPLTGER